jgi:hypothetical protein
MAPVQFISAFYEPEHLQSCFGRIAESTPIQQFALKRGEKTLRHRVVEAVTDRSGRGAYPVFPAPVPDAIEVY